MTAHRNSRRSKLRFKGVDLPLHYRDMDLLGRFQAVDLARCVEVEIVRLNLPIGTARA
jgi:hypothetical protein